MLPRLFVVLLCSSTSSCLSQLSRCTISPDSTYHGLFVDCGGKGLTEIPRDFPDKTTSINLDNNLISLVNNHSFSRVLNLKFLSLGSNQISSLEQLAFVGCGQLLVLRLCYNNVCLDDNVFDQFVNLMYLCIDGCYSSRSFRHLYKIYEIEIISKTDSPNFQGFQNLTSLRKIILDGFTIYGNETFQNLSALRIESLKFHSFIVQIDEAIFWPLTFLQNLTFFYTYSGLAKPLLSLYGLIGRNLTTLELNNVVSHGRVQDYRDVEDRILKKTLIQYLSQICVKHLHLPNNAILYIDLLHMEKSPISQCLTHIKLNRNSLRHFQRNALLTFSTFSELRALDLSDQSTMPSKSSFSEMFVHSEDKYYNVHYMQTGFLIPPFLESINVSRVSSSVGGIKFDIKIRNGKRLLKVDASFTGMKVLKRIYGIENLQYLDLSGNPSINLLDDFFDRFPHLQTLKLSDQSLPQNVLNVQGKRFLQSLQQLKTLHISGNRLVQLPVNLFSSNPLLKHLDLSRNIFSSVPTDLHLLSGLKVLNMAFNSFGSLDISTQTYLESQFQTTSRDFKIDISGNFFSCSCGNFQFLMWLKGSNIFSESERDVACITQDGHITNTKQINLNFIQFWRKCNGEATLLLSSLLFTLLICSILVAMLVATNATKLANMVMNIMRYQILRPKRADFRRDVFVSYAEDDYQWICFVLRPALEDKNLTLYIWDRDSVPGDSIPDQIAENVQQCWKTILYFTTNYERDPWSYMAMMTAINCVDNLNPERLILLLPEEDNPRIPACLLEVVPESCIVRVPADLTQHDPFWDQLSVKIKMK